MGLIRQKRHLAKGSGERPPRERRHRLTPDAVAYVLRALMALPDGTQRQREEKARSQVVFEVFLATGARRMELCTATYDNLECAANRWWLTVNAKGGGYGRLPICERALDSIKRYRVVRGLPPLPEATERGRIITRLGSPDEGISDNMLYRIVKRVFANAVDLANQAGADTVQHQLKRASTHWLRHTTLGSLGEQSKDFRLVQQMGRHASANTTMQYMHEEENRFHDAVAKHLDQLLTVTVPGDA
jgi:integrase